MCTNPELSVRDARNGHSDQARQRDHSFKGQRGAWNEMEEAVLEPLGMDTRSQLDPSVRQQLRDDPRPLVPEDGEGPFFRE